MNALKATVVHLCFHVSATSVARGFGAGARPDAFDFDE